MSTFLDTIKNIAEGIDTVINPDTSTPYDWTFYHDEAEEFNKHADKASYPLIFLQSPINAQRPVTNGRVDVIYSISIFIAHRSKLAMNMDQRQQWVDRCEQALNTFIARCFAQSEFIIEGVPQTSEVFNDFDLNADGWYLNMNIKMENVGQC